MSKPEPQCWLCGSTDVAVQFAGYSRAYCKPGCYEEHLHYEDIPQHDLSCRACANKWRDGSGDFQVRH
jgi:hypothetical protein